MLLENSFEVDAPLETVWAYLLDVERIVPCMPGAELTETVDDCNWKGKLNFKLGPVSLSFAGKVVMAEQVDEEHRIVLSASGMEERGKGAASARVTSRLEAVDGGTRVNIVQDIKLQGQAAQFSRGMMQDVSARLTKQFADCLQTAVSTQMAGEAEPLPPPEVGQVKVLSLLVASISRAIGRLIASVAGVIRRLFAKLRSRAK